MSAFAATKSQGRSHTTIGLRLEVGFTKWAAVKAAIMPRLLKDLRLITGHRSQEAVLVVVNGRALWVEHRAVMLKSRLSTELGVSNTEITTS